MSITDEAVEAQEMLKKQGKTRFIGISAHDINAVVDKIMKLGKHDVVQTTYSYPIGSDRNAAIHKLHEAGIGVVAMKVIVAMSMAGFAPPPKERGADKRGAAGGRQVGVMKSRHIDHRALCKKYSGGRDELPGNDGALHSSGRENAVCAKRGDPSALLPHVL